MIEAEKADLDSAMTVARMCQLLGVDRRRFYEWRARTVAGPTPRQRRVAELVAQIRASHTASDGTYGAPRIHADLRYAGVAVSRKTVAKLMRAEGITGISPRTWHPPTSVQGADPFPVPDLVERQFDQGDRDRAWFSDITYLHTGEGWAYLYAIQGREHSPGARAHRGRQFACRPRRGRTAPGRRAARRSAPQGDLPRRSGHPGRVQSVVATVASSSQCSCSANASAGVRQPRISRGLSLIAVAIALISRSLQRDRSVPLGKY